MFSADYHIKLGQKNVPIDWARARYAEMFRQLHELEKTVDLHIIGGDVFDKTPTMEELELYYEFILESQCETKIIPGNHESIKKNTTFFTFLKTITTKLNPLVEIVDDYYAMGNMDFIPYNKLKDFESRVKAGEVFQAKDILITHVRGEIPPHVKPEVDLSLFEDWKLVLAGDLHSHSNSQRNIVYPGSPCTTSFHRSEVKTGVVIVDTETLAWEFVELKLPQLIRKTIEAGEPMPATEYHHTIYEVTGDMEELGNVENAHLLDKKIVKKSSDCALLLKPDATIEEELLEYLQYIIMLDYAKAEDLLQLLNNTVNLKELTE
jgi:DNA repair exonuclease SbcCD nuclease subunit